MNLINILNKLGKKIENKYEDINSGGCCFFAARVGQELVKLGIPTKIVVASDIIDYESGEEIVSIDDIRPHIVDNSLFEWNNNDIMFGHVGIEFQHEGKSYLYDTGGVKRWNGFLTCCGEPYYLYPGYLTVEEASELADSEGWNDMFNRDDIPAIVKEIKKYFEELAITA